MIKIPFRSIQGVHEGILKLRQRFRDHLDDIFLAIASDNGSEFSRLSQEFPIAKIYCAHSYRVPTNENQNGIVRRFFPFLRESHMRMLVTKRFLLLKDG